MRSRHDRHIPAGTRVLLWSDRPISGSFNQCQLPDGRHLDIRVSGPAGGLPLVFHNGTPAAATPYRAIERAAHERGLRLVTTSRPGYADSTRQPGRSVVDVVADITTVLAAIGAERCLVAGWSGGGPHALACAARLEAAAAALVIASFAPYGAEGLESIADLDEDDVTEDEAALPGEDRLRSDLLAARDEMKEVAVANIVSLLEPLDDVDKAVLTDDVEFAEDLASGLREGLRTGVDGWLDDRLAFNKPWGFDVKEISVPTMIWHGSADLKVPFADGQWLASHVPGASAHLEQGEGHLSIGLSALERMLDELVSAGSGG